MDDSISATAPLFTEAVRGTDGDETAAGTHLVLAHGFTQNTRCWGPFGSLLGPATLVDMPGHGRSGHDRADLTEAAGLLAAVGPGIFVGYSMGGRVALHAALLHPTQVHAVIVIGATAGMGDPQDRADRRQRDNGLADRIERESADSGGIQSFIDSWLATPLFASLAPDQQHREARLANRAEGLAASLRSCGTGTQEPLHERLGTLTMPVLCIAGELDPKFRAESEILAAAIGANATTEVISSAGHACHLEAPEATAHVVTSWLSGLPPAAG